MAVTDIGAAPTAGGGVRGDQLRAVIGRFATGVTVITTFDRDGHPVGSAVDALTSVSLHPPLVLACLREESETLAALLGRRRFAINVLPSGSPTPVSDRDGRWPAVADRTEQGVPVLDGALAWLHCELHDIADGGDHTVVVGHVTAIEQARPVAI